MSLGATLKIKMDSSAVRRGLGKLKSGFAKLGGTLRGVGNLMRRSFKPMAIAIGAISIGVAKSVGFMSNLNNEMKRTGQAVPEILAMRKAFELVGVSADETADIVNDMQERLIDARFGGGTAPEGLKLLNLVLQDLLRMDAGKAFDTIMRSARDAGLSTEETAFALDKIFGGAGMKLTGLAFDYDKLMEEARDSTKGLADQLEAAGPGGIEKVQFAFSRMKTALMQLGMSLAMAFPWEMLVDTFAGLAKFIPPIMKSLKSLFENPRAWFINSLEIFLGMWEKLNLLGQVDDWVNGLMDRLLGKADEIGEAIGNAINSAIGGLKGLLFPGKGKTISPRQEMERIWQKGKPLPPGMKVMGSIFGGGTPGDDGLGRKMLGALESGNRILDDIKRRPGATFIG